MVLWIEIITSNDRLIFEKEKPKRCKLSSCSRRKACILLYEWVCVSLSYIPSCSWHSDHKHMWLCGHVCKWQLKKCQDFIYRQTSRAFFPMNARCFPRKSCRIYRNFYLKRIMLREKETFRRSLLLTFENFLMIFEPFFYLKLIKRWDLNFISFGFSIR